MTDPFASYIYSRNAFVLSLLFCVVGVGLTSSVASAVENPNFETPMEGRWSDLTQYGELNNSWDLLIHGLQGSGPKGAQFLFDSVITEKLHLGLLNLFEHSDIMIRSGSRSLRAGDLIGAEIFFVWARELAPQAPGPEWAMLRLSWHRNKGDLPSHVGALRGAVGKTWLFLPERNRVLARGASLFMVLGLITFFLVVFILLVRYLPLLAQDISDRLPEGVSRFHVYTALWVMILAPIAFRLDWVVVSGIWVGAISLYLSVRERILIGILVAWIVVIPSVNDFSVDKLNSIGDWRLMGFKCAYGLCGGSAPARLEEAANHSAGGKAQEILARHHLRSFLVDRRNRTELEMHLARAMTVAPNKDVIHAIEGNYQFARFGSECKTGDMGAGKSRRAAISSWEAALQANPGRVEAAYNLAFAHRIAGSELKAANAYSVARQLDDDGITYFERLHSKMRILPKCPGDFNANLYLMLPPVSRDGFVAVQSEREPEPSGLNVAFGGLFVRTSEVRVLRPLGGVLLVVLLLFWVISQVSKKAWFCSVCSLVASGVEEPELADLGVCDECVSRRVKGTLWDPKANFFAARQRERRLTQKRGIYRAVAYLVPGWGHLLFERPFVGTGYLVLFLAFFVPSLLWFPGTIPLSGVVEPISFSSFVLAGIAVVFYGMNIWSIYRVAGRNN